MTLKEFWNSKYVVWATGATVVAAALLQAAGQLGVHWHWLGEGGVVLFVIEKILKDKPTDIGGVISDISSGKNGPSGTT